MIVSLHLAIADRDFRLSWGAAGVPTDAGVTRQTSAK